MKVVEYWHGTIKNYRYDGDVSSFSGTMERATDLLEILHTDVCGPMNVEARGGYRYFLTFTDDLGRYGYIYLMKQSLKHLKSSKNFRVKWKIIITRK